MWFWEKRSPSFVGKGGFAPMMRLTIACSATAAFFRVYQKSTSMQRHRLLQMITLADYCSEVVWVHGERKRGRHGYAGDGREDQKRGDLIWHL